ncbi:MAG: 6-phosphogluconolactonase [Nocardioides sp.]|nr:6-phosphogluconolactonase [Nocardioides sp.]
MAQPDVRIHPDGDALAAAAAQSFVERLAVAQARGELPHVVLTGGGIAATFHRAVLACSDTVPVDWAKVAFWWGDERFVAADDPQRNAGQARSDLLDHLPVDPAHVHEVPASDGAADVEAAATAYAEQLEAHGPESFEVVLLGLGPDGHVASLFPDHPQVGLTGRRTAAVTDSPKPPAERVTLTLETLNRAEAVWFLVSGEGKSDAVRRALGDGPVADLPARGARGRGETTWFVDEQAASGLGPAPASG